MGKIIEFKSEHKAKAEAKRLNAEQAAAIKEFLEGETVRERKWGNELLYQRHNGKPN